jgi:hypothetical protein
LPNGGDSAKLGGPDSVNAGGSTVASCLLTLFTVLVRFG